MGASLLEYKDCSQKSTSGEVPSYTKEELERWK
jgi:hypothetical protein